MILEDIKKALPKFKAEPVNEENVDDVVNLLKSNTYYFEKTQNHPVTRKEALEDSKALPPKKTLKDKTYACLYYNKKCAAVIDYIEAYPNEKAAFLGFLILDVSFHKRGLAGEILSALEKISKDKGFTKLELGCYLENEIGCRFWLKKGFKETARLKRVIDNEPHILIKMQKML